MNRAIPIWAAAAALASVLVVSACGSGSTGSTGTSSSSHDMSAMTSSSAPPNSGTTGTAHNAADVAFATGMIPHHAQAVQMADMALKQGNSAKVKGLARQIKAAQDPEITTMSGWLKSWGKPVPATMAGHDMSTMGGSMGGGMMTAEEMTALGKASGAGFDRMWLQMMTRHHQGAIAMGRTELTRGASGEAKTLARTIIAGQTKEIAQMRSLLGASASDR